MTEYRDLPRGPCKIVGHVDYSYECEEYPNGIFCRIYYPAINKQWNISANNHSNLSNNWIPDWEYGKGYYDFSRVNRIFSSTIGRLFTTRLKLISKPGMHLAGHEGDTFPVIVFSHGLGGMRTTYSILLTDIASNGWIVVALEHRDGSSCFTRDKNGEKLLYRDFAREDNERHNQLKYRSSEMLICLQYALPELTSKKNISSSLLGQFYKRLNLDHILLMGHSFGAATCLDTLSRIKTNNLVFKQNELMNSIIATIAFDPWMFPLKDSSKNDVFIQLSDTKFPLVLIINSETFPSKSEKKEMISYLESRVGSDSILNMVTDDETSNNEINLDKDFPNTMLVQIIGTNHHHVSDIFCMVPRILMRIIYTSSISDSAYNSNPIMAITDHVDMIFHFLSNHGVQIIWKCSDDKVMSKKIINRPNNVKIDAISSYSINNAR